MKIVVTIRHDVIAVAAGIFRILLLFALDQAFRVAIVNATQPVSITNYDGEWNLKVWIVQSFGRREAPLAPHATSDHLK